jgi:hypothetical protein
MATNKYKIKWVPPYSSFSDIDNQNIKKQNTMQSYTQFVEYFFPNIDYEIVKNNETTDICIIDIKHTDSASLKDSEMNVLISTENILNKNFFWYSHFNKYSEYGDNKIKIYIYSHISKIVKTKKYIAIPCIYTRINYFLNNYERFYNEPTLKTPFENKLFCLVIKMNFNNRIKDFINKLSSIGKIDDINIYNNIVMNNSCYNSIELLQVLNKYKFVICVENSIQNGYVTEKIFNCLFAKSIPIYSGAPNIYSYFNKDVFVDLDNIGSEYELNETISLIKKLSEDEILYNTWIDRNKISDEYNDENYKYELTYAMELCMENKRNITNVSMFQEKRYTPEENQTRRLNMRLDYQTDFINSHLKSSKLEINAHDIEYINMCKTKYEIDNIDDTIDNNKNIKHLYDYIVSLFHQEKQEEVYSNYIKEIFKNYNDNIKINSYLMLLCKCKYFFEIMNCLDILKKNFHEKEKYIFSCFLKNTLTKEQEEELKIERAKQEQELRIQREKQDENLRLEREKQEEELRIQREKDEEKLRIEREKQEEALRIQREKDEEKLRIEEELRIQREKENDYNKKRCELKKKLDDFFEHLSYFLENENNKTKYIQYLKEIFKTSENKINIYLKLLKPCKNYDLIANSLEQILIYRRELDDFEISGMK